MVEPAVTAPLATARPLDRTGIWEASLIVFISSLCTLVIELVAGRIMAPYIGVSLYTWTSIIGVVLAGITLGNYAGGVLADRAASRRTLGLLFLLGGLSTIGVLVATEIMKTPLPTEISLVPRIVLYTTVIFFLPCFILGMVSPVVVKLTLRDLQRTGNTVGRIYAFSTAGSIIGTFLTGFVLVTMFGTRGIIWAAAIVLLVMAVFAGRLWRTVLGIGLGILIVAAYFVVYNNRDAYAAPCQWETNYYCIRFFDTTIENRPVRALVLDHLIHSYNDLKDPTFISYPYEKIYDELTRYLARSPRPLRALFIGGGGYTFPRFMEEVYPDSQIDVIEIDPGVTAVNYEHMGLSRDTRIKTYNADARIVLKELSGQQKYEIVQGDAFNDLAVPYHLTTREFSQQVADLVADDGMYMANVIDKFQGGQFMPAYLRTLREVFPYVYLVGPGNVWQSTRPSTFVVVGAKKPLDQAALTATATEGGRRNQYGYVLEADRLDEYLRTGPQIVLTDDYAPVDNLTAPLFIERGF